MLFIILCMDVSTFEFVHKIQKSELVREQFVMTMMMMMLMLMMTFF